VSKIKENVLLLLKPQTIIGLLISIAGIYWAFHDFAFDDFFETIKSVKYEYVLLACVLIISSVWLRAIRWKYLFKAEDRVETYSLFRYELIGYFGNNVLPLRLGELLRSYILGKRYHLSKSYVFGTIVLERILDTLALILLSIILLFIYPLTSLIKNYIYMGTILSVILVIFLFILKRTNFVNTERGFLLTISNFFQGFKNLEYNNIPILFILSISTWSIYWVDVHLIQYAFGFEMTPAHSLLLLIVSSLFMAIPSAPGMIGTFHAGVIYVMVDLLATSYTYTVSEATSFAIILHAYGYISYTLLGAIYFARSQFHKNAISEVLKK
jgi:uncharacterized protein (TIRG00374 family)